MDRTPPHPPTVIDANPSRSGSDPWSEFLSETDGVSLPAADPPRVASLVSTDESDEAALPSERDGLESNGGRSPFADESAVAARRLRIREASLAPDPPRASHTAVDASLTPRPVALPPEASALPPDSLDTLPCEPLPEFPPEPLATLPATVPDTVQDSMPDGTREMVPGAVPDIMRDAEPDMTRDAVPDMMRDAVPDRLPLETPGAPTEPLVVLPPDALNTLPSERVLETAPEPVSESVFEPVSESVFQTAPEAVFDTVRASDGMSEEVFQPASVSPPEPTSAPPQAEAPAPATATLPAARKGGAASPVRGRWTRRRRADAAASSPRTGSTQGATAPGPTLSLSDVLLRHTPVRAEEAVAVVLELCARLGQPGHEEAVSPGLKDVLVSPAGAVVLRDGARGDGDIRGLARILHALIPADASTPLPLRLFVTAAISTERYRSVAQFGDALTHFGPGPRERLVAAMFRRASELPAVPTAQRMGPHGWQEFGAAHGPSVRVRLVAVALGAVLCSATAAAWWRWHTSAGAENTAAARKETLPDPAAEAWRYDWQVGPVIVPEVEAPPPPPPRRPQPRPAPRVATLPAQPPVVVPPPAPDPEPVQPRASVPMVPLSIPARRPQAQPPARPVEPPRDPTIYSSSDTDVQPPTLLPSQRIALAPTLAEHSINSLELLIDEQGVVQQARLVNRPQRFSDVSVLSQAKMLKFQPALRNGSPVKYRLQLTQSASRD